MHAQVTWPTHPARHPPYHTRKSTRRPRRRTRGQENVQRKTPHATTSPPCGAVPGTHLVGPVVGGSGGAVPPDGRQGTASCGAAARRCPATEHSSPASPSAQHGSQTGGTRGDARTMAGPPRPQRSPRREDCSPPHRCRSGGPTAPQGVYAAKQIASVSQDRDLDRVPRSHVVLKTQQFPTHNQHSNLVLSINCLRDPASAARGLAHLTISPVQMRSHASTAPVNEYLRCSVGQ